MTSKKELLLKFLIRFVIGYVATALLVFVTRFTYFTYIDQFDPPRVNEPIKVLNQNKEVRLGGALELELVFVKPEPIIVNSQRQVSCRNGDILILESGGAQLPVTQTAITVQVTVPIPNDSILEAGQVCVYQVTGQGRINEFRDYTTMLRSEEFTLVE